MRAGRKFRKVPIHPPLPGEPEDASTLEHGSFEERIAALEARMAVMETRIAILESRLPPPPDRP